MDKKIYPSLSIFLLLQKYIFIIPKHVFVLLLYLMYLWILIILLLFCASHIMLLKSVLVDSWSSLLNFFSYVEFIVPLN